MEFQDKTSGTLIEEMNSLIYMMNDQSSRSQLYINKDLDTKRQNLIKELQMTPVGLCDILKQTIPKGIAYHHSGLTGEE